jgi:glycine/D-amino acid oxidase-like deaminating enzyme
MSERSADIVIVGGGIAGLWCRRALSDAGYSVIVIERSALGLGQTVLSQGILHRGVKYAISPQAARAAHAASEAAKVWDRAMKGEGTPDLREMRVLARSMYMWTNGGFVSRATGAVAANVLSSGVRAIDTEQAPALLRGRSGTVFEVFEAVIDAVSALACLAKAAGGPILRGTVRSISPEPERVLIRTEEAGEFSAGAAVFCAGCGNEELLRLAGIDPEPWCQRRPLHLVYALGAPEALYGHWIASASDKPRLTITSDRNGDRIVWYLGGELAESGVSRSAAEQIDMARAELRECFPRLETTSWEFSTIRVDRCEGRSDSGRRPDGPTVHSAGRILGAWPTKLVLAPLLADAVLGRVRELVRPGNREPSAPGDEPLVPYASPPWRTQV